MVAEGFNPRFSTLDPEHIDPDYATTPHSVNVSAK